jgi:predicted ester cyclase
MSEANKALVRSLLEGADRNDISILDDTLATDCADHNPPPFAASGDGIDAARETFTTAGKIFSDWSHEVVQQFSDGDFVITRLIGRGKHTGEFLGIPASNNDVQMEGIAIHRVVDGKIVEHWGQVDGVAMLAQMGALPPLGG